MGSDQETALQTDGGFATPQHYHYALARALFRGHLSSYAAGDATESIEPAAVGHRRAALPMELVLLILRLALIMENHYSEKITYEWDTQEEVSSSWRAVTTTRKVPMKVTASSGVIAWRLLCSTPVIDRATFQKIAGIRPVTFSKDQGWAG